MIRLCTICGQKDVFGKIWRQAVGSHPRSANKLSDYVKAHGSMRPVARMEGMEEQPAMGANVVLHHSIDGNGSTTDEAAVSDVDEAVPRPDEAMDKTTPSLRQDEATSPADSCRNHVQQGPRTLPTALTQEQLHGLLPPSHELDDYELGERPMTLHG